MTTIINYISETLGVMIPFLSLLVSIIMLPFSHGNIVTALKAVNEQEDEISVEHEGLAGLKRIIFYLFSSNSIFNGNYATYLFSTIFNCKVSD